MKGGITLRPNIKKVLIIGFGFMFALIAIFFMIMPFIY